MSVNAAEASVQSSQCIGSCRAKGGSVDICLFL